MTYVHRNSTFVPCCLFHHTRLTHSSSHQQHRKMTPLFLWLVRTAFTPPTNGLSIHLQVGPLSSRPAVWSGSLLHTGGFSLCAATSKPHGQVKVSSVWSNSNKGGWSECDLDVCVLKGTTGQKRGQFLLLLLLPSGNFFRSGGKLGRLFKVVSIESEGTLQPLLCF